MTLGYIALGAAGVVGLFIVAAVVSSALHRPPPWTPPPNEELRAWQLRFHEKAADEVAVVQRYSKELGL
jgi:hypothetical protein